MVGKRWTESQRRQWEAWQRREEDRLDGLALLADGSPAWQTAKAQPGMTAKIFEMRLARSWAPERAASEPVKQRRNLRSPFAKAFGPDDL